MLDEITHHQFKEWQAVFKIEPFGQHWHQIGTICDIIATANGAKGTKPESFIPWAIFRPAQSPEQMAALFQQYATMHNTILAQQHGSHDDRNTVG